MVQDTLDPRAGLWPRQTRWQNAHPPQNWTVIIQRTPSVEGHSIYAVNFHISCTNDRLRAKISTYVRRCIAVFQETEETLPKLVSVDDELFDGPVLVAAVRKIPPDFYRNFPLSELLHSDLQRIRLVFDIHHHWCVHAATGPAHQGATTVWRGLGTSPPLFELSDHSI